MKLIGSLTSPFVRKVRIALLEKAIPFEMVVDVPWNADTHILDYNPLGKVPALEADDGSHWFDSNVLLHYLEANFPAATRLFPIEPQAQLVVHQLITLAEGVVEAAIAIYRERQRTAERQDAAWIERQRGKVERGLQVLEQRAQQRVWLWEDTFSSVDIAVGCVLLWIDFRVSEIDWRRENTALTALCERLMQRESFRQTVPVV